VTRQPRRCAEWAAVAVCGVGSGGWSELGSGG